MSKLKCKGTALKQELGTVFTTVAQIISLEKDNMEAETFEADTLDNANAGIPYLPTGRTEGGSLSGEMFLDPSLAGHKALLTLLTTPETENWKLVFTDTAEWAFAGAGISLGVTVALNDGLKSSFSIKLDGLPTFPA